MLNHLRLRSKQNNGPIELSNEFASVQLTKDITANGPRLMIKNVLTGSYCYLDPLELLCMIDLPDEIKKTIVDPGWKWK